MASGFDDYIELANSVNALSESIQAIKDRKEEQKRYEKEQQRLDEQAKTEETWRQKNYEMQQTAFEYQKWLNSTQRDREDSSFRRSMADYKAAGVSGLGALGSSAPSGQLTSLPAPQMDTSGSRDVLNSRINSNRNRNQSRLERYKTTLGLQLQMKQLRLEKTNQVLQGLKLGNDILSEKKKRESLQADIDYKTKELEYNETHGFRNQNWQSALIGIVDSYLRKKDISARSADIMKSIANDSTNLVTELNKRKEIFTEDLANDIAMITNKGEYLNQPNALPERVIVSPLTYSRIDKLSRQWSEELARKTYYGSSVLQSCYDYNAFMNYYSKNAKTLQKQLNNANY